jgi:putative acyl-CoA dehydrogenase
MAPMLRPAADADEAELSRRARDTAMQLVLLAQASLLRRDAPTEVAAAFITSRFERRAGQVAGLLAPDAVATALIERAWPG